VTNLYVAKSIQQEGREEFKRTMEDDIMLNK
jgi:hypothetical protein